MRESLAASAIRGLVHPHTGEPITPVGFRKSGAPIWPVMGASEDDDPDENPDDDPNEDEDPDENPDEDDDEDDENAERDAKARREANEKSKKQRLENKRLQKELAERDKRLKEIEDKDKDEATRLTESESEAVTRAEQAEKKVREQALQVAFLTDNKFKWRNPKAALKLADLSKVEIDEDGEVEGLEEALKALAKSDPYLLQGEDDEDSAPPPAGQPPRKTPAKGVKRRSELERKFPALRR